MRWKAGIFTVAALIMAAAGPVWAADSAVQCGCAPEDKIDGSTAAEAKRKIEAAGFDQVRDLTKSCDNFWHGRALRDGREVYVVLSPQGHVLTEGN